MLQLLTTLDWKLIISLVTLALVIFGILYGNNLLGRREKLKIKTSGVYYRITNKNDRVVFEVADMELQRSGEEDTRYLNKILLKLDEDMYNELKKLINFRGERNMVLLDSRVSIPKYIPTKIVWPQYEWEIFNSSDWDKAKEGVQNKMKQVTFEIGLVWEHKPGKTKWKRMAPRY